MPLARILNTLTLSLCLLLPPAALSQKPLLIPDRGAALDVPGAHELPDPNVTYKLLFTVTRGAEKDTDINPTLANIASLVNTLAKYGVPQSNRKFVAVIYGEAAPIILDDATFKASHNGHGNPNIELIQALTRAGVELHVCGQSVMHHKFDPKTIQPEIQLDLAAWITLANYEARGYHKMAE